MRLTVTVEFKSNTDNKGQNKFNDRSSPTRRRVNLHVGVANRFIPNNEQTAPTLEIMGINIPKRATCKVAAENTANELLVSCKLCWGTPLI